MPYTRAEMAKEASRAGHAVSERLVTDWASLGLLGHPNREGRGAGGGRGARYVWNQTQRDLFLSLLARRSLRWRVGRLADFVVACWLYWGEALVEWNQARLALSAWVGIEPSAGSPRARARYMARRILKELPVDDPAPDARGRFEAGIAKSLSGDRRVLERLGPLISELVQADSAQDPSEWDDGAIEWSEYLVLGVLSYERAPTQVYEDARGYLRRAGAGRLVELPRHLRDNPLGRRGSTTALDHLVAGSCRDLMVELGQIELDSVLREANRQLQERGNRRQKEKGHADEQ